ncbi:neither inactivation nor afterpotential protein C isoform X1 [Anastrepha ludens]|uniref:neither inactivation nor afterpotential protein C isoform X1 n=1 Tax=Anastrepha ludens TaxID=28586 RepID=UPI0023B05586|nr:neither inactivation nor afterpotential protein C isoform X1 [Anastrepha ludens]XP_053960690.1 neither inactivation nor afterpotential protein C isoform X1 [Anastrepha ludens]XP_053960691.1 neither inactivation nor afterpotential protein C isoform X1 [Anastrepha ludens]
MYLPYTQLPDPTDKFEIYEEIAQGVNAKVFRAKELENDRMVALKIQHYDEEHQVSIEEEYRTLRDHCNHPNLPEFYGVYKLVKPNAPDEIWFVMEYCSGGTAVDMVNKLVRLERRMREEHIAYIIRETCRGAIELNRNHVIHRDIRGDNILLTKDGRVKLCDFGLSREVDSTFGKRGTCIGSPCWMAPEVVTALSAKEPEITSRADVWALGITTIELADGQPPFADMHPTRVMFQIVRNPPPTLLRPTNWSQQINDFVSECLEKNVENRPMMVEMIEHPFLNELFDNDEEMQADIRELLVFCRDAPAIYKEPEIFVDRGYIKRFDGKPERMYPEDLAAIENATEEMILESLRNRIELGGSYSFIGDVLLSLNSNDLQKDFDEEFHSKYKFKSRSQNSPHIFAVADIAYQDMLHHKEPQHIVFSGESFSGKSTNVRLLINHLCYLGSGNRGATTRVENSIDAIQMLVNAGTPINNESTRCVLQYFLTFGQTGKLSGAVFNMYMLEKLRVSTTDMNQHNFHIFYYFYDFMNSGNLLKEYHLKNDRGYRYLRIPADNQTTKLKYHRDDPIGNVENYKRFESILQDLDFNHKQLETLRKVLAAILNIGNIRFRHSGKYAEVENTEMVTRIAELLRVDEKKYMWSLTNFIMVKGGIAERRQYSTEEARDARDAVASTIYCRLVDWIINKINMNLSFPRAVFGDTNAVVIHDMYGFECFHRNGLEQLMINTFNEQMQYHYNQRIFVNEMLEMEADDIPTDNLNFYDNKVALDNLLTKPDGLFYIIDDASRTSQDQDLIMDRVVEKHSQFVKKHTATEISVAHYTGRIIYDTRAFTDINRDFVPPEMIESFRSSMDENIMMMFTNQLTKAGNLTMPFESVQHKPEDSQRKSYPLNTLSAGCISQVNNLRTLAANFRFTCLNLLKTLTGNINLGVHFVRCIRADLEYKPRAFHADMVQQQMKALGVLDTVIGRQRGYSCRITFQEFLRRYQFLAFDFDETVDITKENCRLLLIRLKMEGWAIGKMKVFLRYYNDEFLARLYEVQVKKVIKVQSMMRALLARKRMKGGKDPKKAKGITRNDEAAAKIQKAFRGYHERQRFQPLVNEKTGQLNEQTADFIRGYAKKWREKSLFQVLLHYRAARFQDFVNLAQQVHIYNQRFFAGINKCTRNVPFDRINTREVNSSQLGPLPIPTKKLPFRLDQIPFYDTQYMVNPANSVSRQNFSNSLISHDDEEVWDSPLQRNPSMTSCLLTYNAHKKEQACQTNWDRIGESDVIYNQNYYRDPQLIKRNQVQMNMNAYNNYSQYNNNYNNASSQIWSNRAGSRRNSLKGYSAPPPPPMPPAHMVYQNDQMQSRMAQQAQNHMNRMNQNYQQRSSFIPSDPVRELKDIVRRSNDEDSSEDPPFNFKAMLRKTNYSRPDSTIYEFNNDMPNNNNENINFQASKLRHTGRRIDDFENSSSNNMQTDQIKFSNRAPPLKQTATVVGKSFENTDAKSFEEAGSYVEEEIAPGVTLSGYAVDI